ncbi:uncharacterized protein [Argopecten irradians]|uniref:uncharacterized protein n=1 Tax=Argopecten irradians TaxID=31199 RepID=UPI0037207713
MYTRAKRRKRAGGATVPVEAESAMPNHRTNPVEAESAMPNHRTNTGPAAGSGTDQSRSTPPELPVAAPPPVLQDQGMSFGVMPTPIASVNNILGLHVSASVKLKITNGEYVELSQLLSNSMGDSHQAHRISLVDGELLIKPKNQYPKISDISKWTDAFIIYISIYTAVHPEQLHGLLKYMQVVRLGALRCGGMDWIKYDEQYRLRKALNPQGAWGIIDNELYLLYMQPQRVSLSQTQTQNSNTLKCFDYNYKGNCTRPNCSYSHKCIKCSGGHASMNCFKGNSNNPYSFRKTNNTKHQRQGNKQGLQTGVDIGKDTNKNHHS